MTIYLPRNRCTAADPSAAGDEPPHGSEAILLVEDNPDVKEVAGMLLGELGYRVMRVDNAAAALAMLASGAAVDLVFSDVVMPGEIDGLALAQRIKEQ